MSPKIEDVTLEPGRERSVERRHPWILSGSVAKAPKEAAAGALVRVRGATGQVLGYGHYSPGSQLRVRMWSLGPEAPPDDLLERRLEAALARRRADPLLAGTDALRLVNAEGDELPGLVVDRFAGVLVLELTSAGMSIARDRIAEALRRLSGASAGLLRADRAVQEREGIEGEDAVLWGDVPAEHVWIDERGRRFAVDVTHGQKTGFYLDQRDARDLAQTLAGGRSVLDLFAHNGGFAVAAARGGASQVTLVETSKSALEVAARNLEANAPGLEARLVREDVHRFLREDTGTYDLIVVDPPPLAKRKKDVERAARAYKDSLLYAFRRARAGSLVFAFSCSHHVGPHLFRQIVFGASLDAGRSFQVLRELGQPSDHPVSIDHPEGAYLTGLLLRATG